MDMNDEYVPWPERQRQWAQEAEPVQHKSHSLSGIVLAAVIAGAVALAFTFTLPKLLAGFGIAAAVAAIILAVVGASRSTPDDATNVWLSRLALILGGLALVLTLWWMNT